MSTEISAQLDAILSNISPEQLAAAKERNPKVFTDAEEYIEIMSTRRKVVDAVSTETSVGNLRNCLRHLGAFGFESAASDIIGNKDSGRRVYVDGSKIMVRSGTRKPLCVTGIHLNDMTGAWEITPESKEGYGRGKGTSVKSLVPEVKDLIQSKWPQQWKEYIEHSRTPKQQIDHDKQLAKDVLSDMANLDADAKQKGYRNHAEMIQAQHDSRPDVSMDQIARRETSIE